MTSLVLVLAASAFAEEKADLGPEQRLRPDTDVRVDIVDPATEQIRYVGEVDDQAGGFVSSDVTVISPGGVVLGTFPSGSVIATNAGVGVYQLVFEQHFLDADPDPDPLENWEITVLANGAPVPGRVWSKRWRIDAEGFNATYAMDGSFYAVVGGGALGLEGVVELKADGLAGYKYSLLANSDGIVGGDGRSRSFDDGSWVANGEHPIYLSPPDPALATYSFLEPTVSNATITADAACGAIVPGVEGGGGTIAFDTNVSGVVHLICDLDQDGVFDVTSDTDFHLLADVTAGPVALSWDGNDNLELPVPPGTYDCVLKVTVGEFHFVANDIETSYEGFRLFEVDSSGNRTGLAMYWNDAEVQQTDTLMPNNQYGLVRSGPNGVSSGLYTAATVANVNARSWGDFSGDGKGNEALLDTYTWLGEAEAGPFAIEIRDVTIDLDVDGLSDAEEECVSLTDPTSADTDGDGAGDWVEVRESEADPLDPDSDDDGVLDGGELADPTTPRDSDGDGLEDPVDPDDDDDGVGTAIEGASDADGDGASNHVDTDDDDDQVPTSGEDWDGSGDWTDDDLDGDTVPDFLDPDEDGDGLVDEGQGDTDGDGAPDFRDPDDDGDGVGTGVEYDVDGNGLADDGDGDGTANWLDTDDDDDGLDTTYESDPDQDGKIDDPGTTDTDNDGTPDFLDPDADGDTVGDEVDGLADADGDGVPGFRDPDDDGDTIPTIDEDVDGDGDPTNDDNDGDGLDDWLDPDDDDDTVPTADEWDNVGGGRNGDQPDQIPDDTDGDGTPDYLDPDDDDDGIPTAEEGDGDTDGDGLPDYIDPDSDNDTIFDREEQTNDSDGDFLPDFQDDDDDNDGVDTWEELGEAAGTPGSLVDEADTDAAPDTDGDRDPDWLDPDDDDDGIPTEQEGGFDDDRDGDGTPNHHDLESDGDEILDEDEGSADRDGDGEGNFLDLDADGDGYDDDVEGTVDSDEDGSGDWIDEDDDDDGVRSLDEVVGDTDGDGTEDRLDTDDDGDGIDTFDEVEDALVHGDDVDEDELDNWVDTDADGDGLDDGEEGRQDLDGDNVPNYLDPDGAYLSWYRGSGLSVACNGAGVAPAGLLAVALVALVARRREGR